MGVRERILKEVELGRSNVFGRELTKQEVWSIEVPIEAGAGHEERKDAFASVPSLPFTGSICPPDGFGPFCCRQNDVLDLLFRGRRRGQIGKLVVQSFLK